MEDIPRSRARLRVLGRRAWSIGAGLLAFLLVMAFGVSLRSDGGTEWTAGTSLVILPSRDIDRWAAAGSVEALSTGQVGATVAEILRSSRIGDAAVNGLGPASGAWDPELAVTVEVVASTAILWVYASAPTPEVAEAMADAVSSAASTYLRTISFPYRLETLTAAAGSAGAQTQRTGIPVGRLALAGLAVGLLVQQIWYRLAVAGHGRRFGPAAARERLPISSRGIPHDYA